MRTKNRCRLPVLISAVGAVGAALAIATAFAPARPTPASAAKAAVTGSHRVGVVRPVLLLNRRLGHR